MNLLIVFGVGVIVGASVTAYFKFKQSKRNISTDEAISALNMRGYYINLNATPKRDKDDRTGSN